MYEIFEDFNDCYFMMYTNGTLLKESKVKKLAELGNVAITLLIEGGEEYTDWRRGEGGCPKTCETRKLLKEYGVLTGASLMATSENHAEIMGDEFWSFLVDENVEYVWTFQYAAGADTNFDLVPTPKQRYERFHKLQVMRKGGAEPCVFQPYAADNVRDKPIIDILRSKFFEGYKKDILFNDNLMQLCPIIDDPQ